MEKLDIYLVDDESRKWFIVNEFVSEHFKQKFLISKCFPGRYDHKSVAPIIDTIIDTKRGTYFEVVYFDSTLGEVFVPDDDMLKLERKIKLKGLLQDKHFFTFEQRLKLNELYFTQLKDRISKINRFRVKVYNVFVEPPNRKLLRTEKRKKLAKENRGLSKSKNR